VMVVVPWEMFQTSDMKMLLIKASADRIASYLSLPWRAYTHVPESSPSEYEL
jgi:hypothetical protein